MNKLRNLFKSKLSINATAAGLALLALFGAAFAVSALLIYGVNRAGSGGPGGIFQPGGDGGTGDPLAVEGLPGPDTSVNLEAWDGAGRVNVLVMGLSSDLARRFEDAYRAAYGYAYDDMEAQIVTVRVIASVTGDLAPVATPAPACAPDRGRVRQAYDPASEAFVPHTVVAMDRLAPEQEIAGPAIIEERGSTVRIGQGAVASFRPEGWLRIEIGAP
jgi:hypothetical protein